MDQSESTNDSLNFASLVSVLQNGMGLQTDIEDYLRAFRLSHGQYSLLLTLLDADGEPLSPSELAKKLGRSKPTITKLLEKLTEAHDVETVSSEADRRKKGFTLTDKAKELLAAIAPGYLLRATDFLKNVSDVEKLFLINILNKLNLREGHGFTVSKARLAYSEKDRLIRSLCASGSRYDVDGVLSFLDQDADVPTTKIVDFHLGTITNDDGIRRIEHYLFHGTQRQRNFCTLFFARRNEWEVVNRAYERGLIDREQAYSR